MSGTSHSERSLGLRNSALRAVQVSKLYPGTVALNQVDFDAQSGAVNILIGANGAGKSTLMRILAGIETPTSGELFLNGSALTLRSPRDAAQKGIAMVHQELSLMPNLTIAENIFAGREIRHAGMLVDHSAQRERSAELLKRLNLNVAPDTECGDLAVGQQQLVEIARALAHRAQVLILDEPTSALSNAEIRTLFRVISELKQNGVAIIYISHRLPELLEIGDVFTVLRDGRVAGTGVRGEISDTWIVERMIGKGLGNAKSQTKSVPHQRDVLRVEHLTVEQDGRDCIHDLSFTLGRGEVVGIYGLLGAGRTELFETLMGQRRESNGQIFLHDQALNGSSTSRRIRNGICLVPEDRQRDGVVPEMSIRGNASLAQISKLTRAGILSLVRERRDTDKLLASVRLKPCNVQLPITSLSGGNQQKTLLARALLTSPAILLLDEPTRGVDVGAKSEIYALIRQLAAGGLSVLFATSDGAEIRELADRVLILSRGVLSAEFDTSEASDEKLLIAASTATQQGMESKCIQ